MDNNLDDFEVSAAYAETPQAELINPTPQSFLSDQERAEIPKLTEETLESVEKKVPSFFAYLLGEQYVPPSSYEPPRGRGRPRKYGPKPVGKRVHKIEERVVTSVKIPVKIQRAIVKEFRDVYMPDLIPVKATVEKIARTYDLAYEQAFDLVKEEM